MKLTWIDWSIVLGFVGALTALAAYTKRYTKSVSDFLAADRCAGRYLLTMSEGMAGLGAASVIANFEKFYKAGFAASWWGLMLAPIGIIIALSGWVLYRYRETRAMTMAQFFEMRYSKKFRVYAGMLAWISGTINYGIFPSIIASFLIYFCGFPEHFIVAGVSIWTFPVVMFVMLSIAVFFTLSGGMIAVMITDFIQAQFTNIVFLLIMIVLFTKFSWTDITTTLENAPAGKSMMNPFDQSGVSDFNFYFFAIFAFKAFYNCLGWQGSQGYNCSAKSPHEAKMAKVLGEWRSGVTYLMLLLMPICAYVLMHAPEHAQVAQVATDAINQIQDPQVQKQMTVPIALSQILPAGVMGLLCAAMISAAISTDDTYLHSWGSIFIQDVLLPFKKKPLTQKQHLKWLRISIVGVAVFAFFFSLLFPLRDYLFMFFLLTGTIYLGGSGAVIIGGLYWRRATTQGAWAAMTTGWVIAITGITLQVLWPKFPALVELTPKFPLNGAWLALVAYLSSVVVYVAVSLLTCKEPFNLEKMLHRGEYALPGEQASKPARGWRALGITSEFTLGDKIIYYFKLCWTGTWFFLFVGITLWSLIWGIPESFWSGWWGFKITIAAVMGVGTIIWFLWGGIRDLLELFRTLKTHQINETDDGRVEENVSSAN
ncbi:MAG TPA: sodium:solute symporter [Phycisphaerales bacterium]|nr:sodium:solute symporter [Phycisphaerales bacterium]